MSTASENEKKKRSYSRIRLIFLAVIGLLIAIAFFLQDPDDWTSAAFAISIVSFFLAARSVEALIVVLRNRKLKITSSLLLVVCLSTAGAANYFALFALFGNQEIGSIFLVIVLAVFLIAILLEQKFGPTPGKWTQGM
ncbi:hypothetical protein [Corynebacterium cystitidis]|uniref:hypothetical protein n=1 Tax=Corynebacterium cystitidis TaxID=35757 RepID=UPI00211E30B3|nr:hypothetical protein [Corynebacterium cystitidis]